MSTTASRPLDSVRELLQDAVGKFAGTPEEVQLVDVLTRLDEPLRVAIAGKVKTGKSTLLNALVGEELAPTDEGECTRIVTWYQNGHTYQVILDPHEGEPRQVPFTRDDGAIDVQLGEYGAEQIERLVVEWPSRSLEQITLIDTPGIGSLSVDVSERSHAFLTPSDDRVTPADAVVYLMKHLHTSDVRFLEAFHDEEVSQATPVNAIAILSRADEIGGGRLDSMESAQKIAARYSGDTKVRRLAQTVVPVAGLLAQSGSTLREAEFQALTTLARTSFDEVDALLVSVDRFVNGPTTTGLTGMEREVLLDRFGLFGVRLAVRLIQDQRATTSSELSVELVRRSGLHELQATLVSNFGERRDLLKARAGLLAVESAIRRHPDIDDGSLADSIERISASAHEFNELRLLLTLRSGGLTVKDDDVDQIERLIGTSGTTAPERLGLEGTPTADATSAAAQALMAKWQRRAESPMSSPDVAAAARVLVRTCEGILVGLADSPPA